jgi:hypothetical protein
MGANNVAVIDDGVHLQVVTLDECGLHFECISPLLERASVVELRTTRLDGQSPFAVRGAGFAPKPLLVGVHSSTMLAPSTCENRE